MKQWNVDKMKSRTDKQTGKTYQVVFQFKWNDGSRGGGKFSYLSPDDAAKLAERLKEVWGFSNVEII